MIPTTGTDGILYASREIVISQNREVEFEVAQYFECGFTDLSVAYRDVL